MCVGRDYGKFVETRRVSDGNSVIVSTKATQGEVGFEE